jgi:RNA polymerase sigma-70 factor (ECF subfamily)
MRDMPAQPELIPHLFRSEYRKIVAVLTGLFGFDQIEIAEDIAADTFVIAIETWGLKGLPESPTAWLYNVAKNNARNYLKKNAVFLNRVSVELQSTTSQVQEPAIDLSAQNITDSQLKMMFAICHPMLSKEAQICMALRVLCGFGIEEIADAFLSNRETINKRLYRAKEILRSENISMELPGQEQINEHLNTVLTAIYLLFNEGYYSISKDSILRKDFCLEAIRLCHMLVKNIPTDLPSANALLSLMCFHASRFEARINSSGEFVLYEDQEVSLWNQELIEKGEYYLSRAASGDIISKYHLEAAIAYWHTQKTDTAKKWANILQLYNQLLAIEYSPLADLNRIYALSKAIGKLEAIAEAKKIPLMNNLYYFVLMGELFIGVNDLTAKIYLERALSLSKTKYDKTMIQNKIISLS